MKTLGIIPARYASSRLPGKVLEKIGSKTMLQRVYERTLQAGLDQVVIATDDERVVSHVESFGAKVVNTSENLQSGTERCAEALRKLEVSYDVIVNVQGDEPFINPEQIRRLAASLQDADPHAAIATLTQPITDPDVLKSPNTVKVIQDQQGRAIYFSRFPIPYQQKTKLPDWVNQHAYFQHIGIYAYRASVLPELVKLPESTLEKAESLEQLRWLEHGYAIQLVHTDGKGIGVDTPEDLEAAREYLKQYPGEG